MYIVKAWTKLESGLIIARIRYDLPTRAYPFKVMLSKVYGKARLRVLDAWESLGAKIIRQIMQETGYTLDDVN